MILNGIKKKNIWALDIETENWTTIVLYYLTDGATTYKGNSVPEMVQHYLKVPKDDVIISHNGGRFDFLPLLDGYDGNWQATIASGIINMRAEDNAILIDSYRLFVLSLDKWTNSKTKLPFECKCEYKCGGYCRISKSMSQDDMRILEEYCYNDCIILLTTYIKHLEKLSHDGFDVYNKSGVPRSTIGSVAYKTAKRWCDLPEGKLEHTFYTQTKQAYYGGNNNCISAFSEKLYLYDINSAYPAEQLKPLPTGDHTMLYGVAATHAYADEKPGLYYIKAYQEPCNLPCLPRRMQNGRVVWSTGYTSGLYVLREAQLAEQECSYFDIEYAIIWEKSEPIYAKYIETCYELRQKYKKAGDNYEHVVKILLNSLYGKLAQNTKQSELYKFEHVDDTPDCEGQDEKGRTWEPIHGTKYWLLTSDNMIPESAKPWQAAYITGNTRVNIYNFAKPVMNDIAYIDTDCIYTRKPITENLDDNKLGAFKFEGEALHWRSVGPKVYNYEKIREGKPNEQVYKAKGLPFISADKFNDYMNGITVLNEKGVNGVISSIKRNGTTFTRRHLERTNNADRRLLGTRFITGPETSIPLHIEKGATTFVWPGRAEKPEDFHPWLKLTIDEPKK